MSGEFWPGKTPLDRIVTAAQRRTRLKVPALVRWPRPNAPPCVSRSLSRSIRASSGSPRTAPAVRPRGGDLSGTSTQPEGQTFALLTRRRHSATKPERAIPVGRRPPPGQCQSAPTSRTGKPPPLPEGPDRRATAPPATPTRRTAPVGRPASAKRPNKPDPRDHPPPRQPPLIRTNRSGALPSTQLRLRTVTDCDRFEMLAACDMTHKIVV